MLEDAGNELAVIVFPKALGRLNVVISSGKPILCSGSISDEGKGEHEWKMLLEDTVALADLESTAGVAG